MEERDLSLEEYHVFLKDFILEEESFRYRDDKHIWEIFYIEAVNELETIEVSDSYDYNVSGNNRDGFIITQYRLLDYCKSPSLSFEPYEES